MELFDPTEAPDRALVIAAHPDDIDFGMAGTVAALVAAGTEVTYAIVTGGEAGPPEDLPRSAVATMRKAEQEAAASEVGVSSILWLGHRDGAVVPDLALRRDLSRAIRKVRPDLVLTQSPERRWDRIYASHPDHLAVGEAAIASVYPDSRNPHAHTELLADEHLEPHTVKEVWVVGLDPVDLAVDVTDVIDRKIAALASHESQTAQLDVEGLLTTWARETAERHGFDAPRLVEVFKRVATA